MCILLTLVKAPALQPSPIQVDPILKQREERLKEEMKQKNENGIVRQSLCIRDESKRKCNYKPTKKWSGRLL